MQIHWHQAKWVGDVHKEQIEERIHELADQGHNDLIDVRISGNPSRHKGHTEHEVKITCEARGQEIVARRTGPKLDRALHDALESFKQQVRHMRSRRNEHRESRGHNEPSLIPDTDDEDENELIEDNA
ncbi:MAG: ribosome-associated translation inhibitor RaiA [Myxococcota bacterium]